MTFDVNKIGKTILRQRAKWGLKCLFGSIATQIIILNPFLNLKNELKSRKVKGGPLNLLSNSAL